MISERYDLILIISPFLLRTKPTFIMFLYLCDAMINKLNVHLTLIKVFSCIKSLFIFINSTFIILKLVLLKKNYY